MTTLSQIFPHWRGVITFFVLCNCFGIGAVGDVGLPVNDPKRQIENARFGLWRYWNTQDGLTSNWTTLIDKSPTGLLFAAHGEGEKFVDILDGYRVRRIPSPGHRVAVTQNPEGQIWATRPDGLGIFRGGIQDRNGEWDLHERVHPLENSDRNYPHFLTVYVISFERDRFYVLKEDRIYLYDASTKTITDLFFAKDTPLIEFITLQTDYRHAVWITGRDRIARIPLSEGRWDASTPWTYLPVASDDKYEAMTHVHLYSENEIVVTGKTERNTSSDLLHWDGQEWTLLYTGEFRDGWLGYDDGIWLLRPDSGGNKLSYIKEDVEWLIASNRYIKSIRETVVESRYAFWLATGSGLARYNTPLWMPDNLEQMEGNRVDFGLIDSSGSVWISHQKTLSKFQDGDWRTYSFPGRIDQGLFEVEDGRILIFGMDRCSVLSPITESFETSTPYPGRNSLRAIHRTHDKRFLMTDLERLYAFDSGKYQVIHTFDRETLDIRALLEQKNGDIWIGSVKQLERLRNGVLTVIGESHGFDGSSCGSLLSLGDERFWVGGLGRIDQVDGQTWSEVKVGNFGWVRAMTRDQLGVIWAATDLGLFAYNDESWVFHSPEDGLYDEVVRMVISDGRGRAWACTDGGVNRYVPQADQEPPETYIPLNQNSPEISYDAQATFSYTAEDKWKNTAKERLLYSYRINDESWSTFTQESFVSFPSLPIGKHTLSVKAMDRD